MDGVKTYEDGIACAFDLLKVAACNTDDARRSEILEEAAEDIIELAPTYKREWKDLTAALAREAALGEELAAEKKWYDQEIDEAQKHRVAAEQRNAELIELLRDMRSGRSSLLVTFFDRIDALTKPTGPE